MVGSGIAKSTAFSVSSAPDSAVTQPVHPKSLLADKTLLRLALKGLSRAQKLVLVKMMELRLEGLTMSSVASRLEEAGVPLSTAKWSLRRLRSLGLLRCGDAHQRGLPSRLTPLGRALAELVNRGR